MLAGGPAKSLVIPYLASTSPIATTVTAFNPNSTAATVQVKVLGADASAIGNTQITVPANGRASSPIATWVPAADGQNGGYITLDSDQPLVAQAVIGPAAGDVAAVAALPPAASAPPPPAQAPALAVDQTSLSFGNVATGQTKALTLAVKNNGTAALTVTGINPASGAFPFTVSPTSFTVAAGGQQAVSVTFKPADTGAVQSSFTFASNDPQGASVVIGLTGSGVNPPAIAVTPARLDFGSVNVGATASLTLTVGNTGSAPLTMSGIASGNPLFAVTAPALPFNVAAGAQQAVTIRFSPTAAGAQTGTLAVASNDPAWQEKMIFAQKALGLQPSPFDAWLTTRGQRTLSLRMERHSANALELAQWLETRKGIRMVRYPFLPSHPQYELARRQMKAGSGILIAVLDCPSDAALAFCKRLRLFTLAESLGGVESLICHPPTMTHASVPA